MITLQNTCYDSTLATLFSMTPHFSFFMPFFHRTEIPFFFRYGSKTVLENPTARYAVRAQCNFLNLKIFQKVPSIVHRA